MSLIGSERGIYPSSTCNTIGIHANAGRYQDLDSVITVEGDTPVHLGHLVSLIKASVACLGFSIMLTCFRSLPDRYFLRQSQSVYLVDFCTYKPPEEWKLSQAEVMEIMRRKKCFTDESLAFMERILANSGTGG